MPRLLHHISVRYLPKLLIPAVAPPKRVPASRQTAMLVLKHNIYAPKDVD